MRFSNCNGDNEELTQTARDDLKTDNDEVDMEADWSFDKKTGD